MDPFPGRPLQQLTSSDIRRLVDDAVPEGLHLDYKETLDLSGRDEKKEFLRDVTAFANAEGGLLIYGVREERKDGKPTGVAAEIVGIPLSNPDEETLRIEQLLRDAIDARLPTKQIHPLHLHDDSYVLLIRVPASLRAPHMVVLGETRRFYLRVTGGNQDMSTAQIRDAVLRTQGIEERIRAFVKTRLRKIQTGHPLWMLHIIPLVRVPGAIDVTDREVIRLLEGICLIDEGAPTHCLEGFKVYRRPTDGLVAHGLAFRDGTVEFLDERLFYASGPHRFVKAKEIHTQANACLEAVLPLYREGFVQPPLAISLALDHVAGHGLTSCPIDMNRRTPDDRIWPDPIVVELYAENLQAKLKPLLDVVWNAFGYDSCPGFDEKGEYQGYRLWDVRCGQ
jgi:hypothetical protein